MEMISIRYLYLLRFSKVWFWLQKFIINLSEWRKNKANIEMELQESNDD